MLFVAAVELNSGFLLLFAALISVGFSKVDSNSSQINDDSIPTTGSPCLSIASTQSIKSKYTPPRGNPYQDSCFVPPQPDNGARRSYRDFYEDDPDYRDVKTGVELAPGSLLYYTCDPGYKLNGSDLVLCEGLAEWSQIPNCVAAGCSPLNSTTMTAKCFRFGRWVDCDSSVFQNKSSEVSCRPGYSNTTSSETIENETVDCDNDGGWEPEQMESCGVAMSDITTDFPWRASVYWKFPRFKRTYFKCSATIIRNNLVLTAANCVYNLKTNSTMDSKELIVMTGNSLHDYNHPLHESKIIWKSAVEDVYVHCDYHGKDSAGDIALLKIKDPFEFSSFRLPACLGNSSVVEETIIDDSDAYGSVAEFGATLIGRRPIANSFTSVKTVPYLPNEKCNSSRKLVYAKNFTSDKFCSGYPSRYSTVCISDQGGGLVIKKHGLWHVIGVVTTVPFMQLYTEGKYGCENYAIHTNVTLYTEWIQNVISNLERHESHPPCNNDE